MSENNSDIRRKDAYYLFLLALLIFIANFRFIFSGQTYQALGGLHHDFEGAGHCLLSYIHEHYLSGFFPLWFPTFTFGLPGVGSFGSALFLPNFTPFYSLISYPFSLIAFCVFNYLLISIFSYMLFRKIGLSCFSSMFAAAWTTLAGYTTWISQFHHSLGFLPWFYIFMWAAVSIMKNIRLRFWMAGSFTSCLMILSGEAESLIYTIYFAGLWLLVYGIYIGLSKNKWAYIIILAAAMALIASLMSACQVLPALNFLSRTVRVEGFVHSSFAETFVPFEQVLYPGIFLFSRKLANLYMGLFPLFFAFLGLFVARKKESRIASAVVLIAIILILLAGSLGISKFLHHLPLISFFIRHFKLAFVLQFCFITLSGLGLDYFLEKVPKPSRLLVTLFILFGLVNIITLPGITWRVMSGLLVIGCVLAIYRANRLFIPLFLLILAVDICSFLWITPYKLERPRHWPLYEKLMADLDGKGRAQVMYPGLSLFDLVRPYSIPVQVGGFDGGQAFDTWLSFPMKNKTRFLSAVDPWMTILEKTGYTRFDFPTFFKSRDFITPQNRHLINLVNLRYIFCEDMAIKEAERRPVIFDPEYFLNPARREAFSPYKVEIYTLNGDEVPAITTKENGEFRYVSRFDPADRLSFSVSLESEGKAAAAFRLTWRDAGRETAEEIFSHVLTLSDASGSIKARPFKIQIPASSTGEGALIFRADIEGEDSKAAWINPVIINNDKTLRWLAGEGRMMAFENTEVLPRARIVHEVLKTADDEEAVDLIKDRSRYNPKLQAVVFENAPSLAGFEDNANMAKESAELIKHHPDYVRLEAELDRPGWLVLSDTYFPGWRALIDGGEERIYRTDLTFRGIPLEAGKHEILFSFEPMDFRIGLWTSLSTLAAFIILIFWSAVLRRV